MSLPHADIKLIIGLGNPGTQYYMTRHSIGFRVVDALAEKYSAEWEHKADMHSARVTINSHDIILVKPQTFMNTSGKIVPHFLKKGIKAENIAVVHDELELPFGQVKIKQGGSAKGHNGLKSIIQACGDNFWRIRCGIGRPAEREAVPDYVLQPFHEQSKQVDDMIAKAVNAIEELIG